MSHTPFFHISSDSNFGSFCWDSEWRVSFFAVSLGGDKYYFLTWVQGSFMFYSKISLLSHLKSQDKNKVESAAMSYETLINSDQFKAENDDKVLDRHKEYLKERTSDFRASYANSLNKINNYSAICIAYLALLTFLTTSLLEQKGSGETTAHIIAIISFSYGVYYFINAALLLRFALKVKGAVSSKFATIKKKTTDVVLVKAAYIDWMSSRNQVEDNASVLLNVEKYLYSSISCSILAWIALSFMTNAHVGVGSGINTMLSQASAIEVVDCEGKVNMEQISKVATAFEHKHIASIVYSQNNHIIDSILPFLKVFSAENSSQINYEIEPFDSDCKSILVLIKDDK